MALDLALQFGHLWASSLCKTSVSRKLTKTRMMAMLTCTARELRNTLESIATPSWVKTRGKYLMFWPRFKVPDWNLEDSASSLVS